MLVGFVSFKLFPKFCCGLISLPYWIFVFWVSFNLFVFSFNLVGSELDWFSIFLTVSKVLALLIWFSVLLSIFIFSFLMKLFEGIIFWFCPFWFLLSNSLAPLVPSFNKISDIFDVSVLSWKLFSLSSLSSSTLIGSLVACSIEFCATFCWTFWLSLLLFCSISFSFVIFIFPLLK